MRSKGPEFCLRWNNHHSVLVSVLDALLEREKLVDVTLAAEGQFLNVHRLVLFACSQYFEDLLSQQPDKPAVIFLKDVSFNDLKALVEYMYKGEVNVSQDRLASFMETAEALKIKGLVETSPKESEQQKQKALRVVPLKNTAPVLKMSSPAITSINSAKSIQQTPAATSSMAMNESQESDLPQEREMMEGEVTLTLLPSTQDEEVAEIVVECEQNKNMECSAQQDAEDCDPSISREETSGTHSEADPSDVELEHSGDGPTNTTAESSRPKRKAKSKSTASLSATSGKCRGKGSGVKARGSLRKVPSASKIHPEYSCSCGRKYTLKRNLNRHRILECNKEPSFLCPFPGCTAAFRRKHHLQNHETRFHK